MEVYLLNGIEVTLEELQAQADASETDLETFKALYKVTVKTKDVAEKKDAIVTSTQPASLEQELEASNSRYAELTKEIDTKYNIEKNKTNHNKALGVINPLVNKKREAYQSINELERQITKRNLDPDQFKSLTVEQVIANPDRMINQKEDNVVGWLKESFPYLDIKASGVKGISNNVTIDTGNGYKEIDLEDFFQNFDKKKKQEIVDVLKELNASKKIKTDKEIIGLSARNLGKNVEDLGVESVNTYLKNSTPYQVETVIDPDSISTDKRIESIPVVTYNVLKDGEIVANMPSAV